MRTYGTVLIGENAYKRERRQPAAYTRYFVDTAALAAGRLVPVTKPEIIQVPTPLADQISDVNEMITAPPQEEKTRPILERSNRKRMKKADIAAIKPTREQLEEEYRTMSQGQIARKYGISQVCISKWMREYGIEARDPKRKCSG